MFRGEAAALCQRLSGGGVAPTQGAAAEGFDGGFGGFGRCGAPLLRVESLAQALLAQLQACKAKAEAKAEAAAAAAKKEAEKKPGQAREPLLPASGLSEQLRFVSLVSCKAAAAAAAAPLCPARPSRRPAPCFADGDPVRGAGASEEPPPGMWHPPSYGWQRPPVALPIFRFPFLKSFSLLLRRGFGLGLARSSGSARLGCHRVHA